MAIGLKNCAREKMKLTRILNNMKDFKKFNLKTFDGEEFKLTAVEFKDVVPFEVKRVYYVTDLKGSAKTGEHCHKVEQEVFIQVQGSSMAVIDQGQGLEEIPMQGPSDIMYVPNFVWHAFKDPSPDCVILALSSTNYNPDRSDYVEDYEEFKKISPYYSKSD